MKIAQTTQTKKTVCEGPCCLLVTNSPIYIRAYPPYWLIIIFPNYPSPTGLHPWSPPWVPDLAQWNPNYPWKAVSPIPRCNPWCWNIYPYLPQKLPSYVGKYSIYGAYGLGISWFYCNYLLMLNAGNFREWSISSLSIIIPATPSNPSIPLRKNAPTQRFRPTQCVVPGDSHILVGKISIPNVFGTCPIHQVLINTIRYYPNDSPGKCGRTF